MALLNKSIGVFISEEVLLELICRFLRLPCFGLWSVIVAFPGHTHLLFEEGCCILYFRPSGSWEILSASVNESDVIVFRRNTTKEIYSQIDITFTIKRNPGLFILNTIIPTVTSSYLSLVTFLVPAGSGEKTSFAVTAMVVQAILFTLFFNQVPGASTSTSIFCKLMKNI